MNRNLEIFTKMYHPYKIERLNSVFVFKTMDGDFAVKVDPKIDYKKLYKYLKSRNFDYLPDISSDTREDMVVFKYEEDLEIDKNQKILDLINLVSLLHSKTVYFKDVTIDKYKEIYQLIKDNIIHIDAYYDEMFMEYIHMENNSPSNYLFLRNYTLIYNACKYTLDKLEEWYLKINDKTKQRVVLVHNNLRLDHFIKNDSEYLISWDNYTFDSPVLDLFNLYKNEWENVSFKEVISTYLDDFNLLEDEKLLFYILICIPYKIEFKENEYDGCREIRRLINYLLKTSSIIDKN